MAPGFSKTYTDAVKEYQALTAKRAPAGKADVDAIVKACRSTEKCCADFDAALKAAETATDASAAARSMSMNLKRLNQDLRKTSSAFAIRGAVGGTDAQMKKGFESLMASFAKISADADKEMSVRIAALKKTAGR